MPPPPPFWAKFFQTLGLRVDQKRKILIPLDLGEALWIEQFAANGGDFVGRLGLPRVFRGQKAKGPRSAQPSFLPTLLL